MTTIGRIDVQICKECYDKKHFSGGLLTKYEKSKCSYCEKITNNFTVGYEGTIDE